MLREVDVMESVDDSWRHERGSLLLIQLVEGEQGKAAMPIAQGCVALGEEGGDLTWTRGLRIERSFWCETEKVVPSHLMLQSHCKRLTCVV